MKTIQLVIMVSFIILLSACQKKSSETTRANQLNPSEMRHIGSVEERYQSYNIEMVEVVGGKFWIPYDKIDTTKKPVISEGGVGVNENLYRTVEPIDLYNKRLRMLASALGPAYVRVSGSWANSVYFQDNDAAKLKTIPAGFKDILTRAQWKGVVDFVHAVDGKLVTSFAINSGVRDKQGIWTPVQAKQLVDYTHSIGGEIAAAELFNEPNFAAYGGAPKGYNGKSFAQDIKAFKEFSASNLPDMKVVGPGSVGEGYKLGEGITSMLTTDSLLFAEPRATFDIFSYHYYGTVSKRCAFGSMGTTEDQALTEDWLSRTVTVFDFYKSLRDKYNPGVPIWITETADAACGGNPWGATFLDSFRYLEQMGRLAKEGVTVVMHNTLAASEYGLLEQDTYDPRPNYWAALLWSKLMGPEVFDAGINTPGVNVYAHNTKEKAGSMTLLIINTTDSTATYHVPMKAEQYTLTSKELTGKVVQLNGHDLALSNNDEMPAISGVPLEPGDVSFPPTSITFITMEMPAMKM